MARIATAVENLRWAANHVQEGAEVDEAAASKLIAATEAASAEYEAQMNDDFNTAGALAAYFNLVTEANTYLEQVGAAVSEEAAIVCAASIMGAFAILGITIPVKAAVDLPDELVGLAAELIGFEGDDVADAAEALLDARAQARAAKDWGRADAIRDRLKDMGLMVEDTNAGARIKRA